MDDGKHLFDDDNEVEGFQFTGVIANTPKNVEALLSQKPDEKLMLMSPSAFKAWKKKLLMFVICSVIFSYTVGVIVGHFI
jgi:hypothetical protein